MDDQTTTPILSETPPHPVSADSKAFKPVAPYWHTALMIAVMATVALLSAKTFALRGQNPEGPFGQYVSTIIWLWLLAALAYLGMRRGNTTIREVIGGSWKGFDDVLIDLAIAAGFWLA